MKRTTKHRKFSRLTTEDVKGVRHFYRRLIAKGYGKTKLTPRQFIGLACGY